MRNNAVSMVRVLAMFMIVLCHIFSWLGINVLAMIFNVGVEIFLLISGYLYSNRKIDNAINFLKKRWIKLCTPMYIIFICLLIYNLTVSKNLEIIKTIPIYLLNLQGISFIAPNIQVSTMPGMGHLWFLSIIMISYVLLVIIKKVETNAFWQTKWKVRITYILLFVIDCVFAMIGIQIAYFIVFFIGYVIGKREMKFEKKLYIILTISMIGAMVIRLIARNAMDGSVIYDNIIAIMTHTILAVWIYATINLIYKNAKKICDIICRSKLWIWLEKHSMMIYMTHYIFLIGKFNVANLNGSILGKLVVFTICTMLASAILNAISARITR